MTTTSIPAGRERRLENAGHWPLYDTAGFLIGGRITPVSIVGQTADKDDAQYMVSSTYNFAEAEKEVESPETGAPATGLLYNGLDLIVKKRGQTIFKCRASSGVAGRDETEKGWGPIPDGRYFISPHKRMPKITKFQPYPGIGGALGIDVGFQEIEDKDVQTVWGKARVAIEGTKFLRNGFYLHGGLPGFKTTHGCIKVADEAVFGVLRTEFGARLPLIVNKSLTKTM